jgi:hypothetical protein
MTVAGVACSSEEPNQPPSITSLVADPTSLAPGGGSTIACVANDSDGDALSYTWTCTGGTISGTGDTITWIAPSVAGAYIVEVVVDDGNGGSEDDSVAISVAVAPTDGSISIQSNPAGAEVYLDGIDTGDITPYTLAHISAGEHVVKLEYPSYKWRSETVTVTAGEITYINWALTYTATQTLTLQPEEDAGKSIFVDQHTPGNNYSTNPLLSTNGDLSAGAKRTYIQFDLGSIPSTALIINASLGLYYMDSWEVAAGLVGVYRVTGNWNESTTTWNNQPATDASPMITVMVPAAATDDFIYWDIKALAQEWVNGDIANQGVMLRDTDETTSEGWKFFSSSNLNPLYMDQCPKLIITYYDPTP